MNISNFFFKFLLPFFIFLNLQCSVFVRKLKALVFYWILESCLTNDRFVDCSGFSFCRLVIFNSKILKKYLLYETSSSKLKISKELFVFSVFLAFLTTKNSCASLCTSQISTSIIQKSAFSFQMISLSKAQNYHCIDIHNGLRNGNEPSEWIFELIRQ